MAAAINGGLAVFVKTPELSPVKTRLAADIGTAAARRAYDMMLATMAAMMRQAQSQGITVYWAVGEAAGVGHRRWREFPVLFTGDGDLGARLNHIYSVLQQRHGRAAVAGSDCPGLSAALVVAALQQSRGNIVVGPTTDGGFYLFAAARRLSPHIWHSVAYSCSDTLAQLLRHFPPQKVQKLPILSDVDDKKSMLAAGLMTS